MKLLFLIVIYKVVMPILLKLVGVRISHKTAYQEQKQFIVVANHNSHVDTMALLASMPVRLLTKTHPVATANYFGKKKWLAFISNLLVNTVLIKQKDNALQLLEEKLKKGHSLIFFPEGTRGKPGEMQAFRSGIGVLLQAFPHIPYIPVWIEGTGKILPKGSFLPVPFEAEVKIGSATLAKGASVEEIVEEVQTAIIDLRRREQL
jgi:1-acyl-sn-glycerol-3-phosphate acyltransferase